MEQALLLPSDMTNLRSTRKHEVFLGLKKDLEMVSPSPSTLSLFFSFFILFLSFFLKKFGNTLPFSFFLLFNHVSFLSRLFKPHLEPRRW